MLNANLSIDRLPTKAAERLRKGMRSPQVTVLPRDTELFRFTSSTASKGQLLTGAWWIGRPGFQHIVAMRRSSMATHRSSERALTLGFLARIALAVKQEWPDGTKSLVDVLVHTRTLDDIAVFAGKGRTQHNEKSPRGINLTWTGSAAVEQLYLPFLDRSPRGTDTSPDASGGGMIATIGGVPALRLVSSSTIASQQLY